MGGALFSSSESVGSRGRALAAAAALGALVIGAAALAVMPSGGRQAPAVGASADAPLELLALEHDRDKDRLTVRGIVRNPEASAAIVGLVAIVSVFGRDRGLIASGQAAVSIPTLTPGAEAPFV